MKFLKSLCCILLTSSFFIACGPVYETTYSFAPPDSQSGKTCVFQCDTSKYQCQQIEDLQTERCQTRSEREYDRCKDRGEKYCYEESCSSDYSKCEDRFRTCYQACGGKVTAQTVCTAFCDQK